jgi:hypothetical protein
MALIKYFLGSQQHQRRLEKDNHSTQLLQGNFTIHSISRNIHKNDKGLYNTMAPKSNSHQGLQ